MWRPRHSGEVDLHARQASQDLWQGAVLMGRGWSLDCPDLLSRLSSPLRGITFMAAWFGTWPVLLAEGVYLSTSRICSFDVVWVALYRCMGVGAYLLWWHRRTSWVKGTMGPAPPLSCSALWHASVEGGSILSRGTVFCRGWLPVQPMNSLWIWVDGGFASVVGDGWLPCQLEYFLEW
ncbi:hypothetical protein GOP47_0001811 [Adiantum capillus-veneris]|uniref:Uncharacterized protein n=1 Tax=Adiantum capillus-veneris TaxID=13818 RepID=A0A9D4VAF7_ADICA|nr:hypothetical protein GOP47_0001811 [Adiantum capillus-veneris]